MRTPQKTTGGKEDEKMLLLGVLGLFVLTGCGGYGMVTDPTSKNGNTLVL